MFRCQYTECREQRRTEMDRLLKQLGKNTNNDTLELIKTGLLSVESGNDMEKYQLEFLVHREHRDAVKAQNDIGWHHFFYGRIALQWREIGPTEEINIDPLV